MRNNFKSYQKLLAFALIGLSSIAECDSDVINQYFLPDLLPMISEIDTNLFTASDCNKIEIQKDFPSKLKRKLIDDLKFLANIRGGHGTLLHQMDFDSSQVLGTVYCAYLKRRIYSFEYAGSGGEMSVAMSDHRGTVKLTDFYFSLPLVMRLSTLIHEARHTLNIKGGQYGHYPCPDPFKDENNLDVVAVVTGRLIAGLPVCDRTLDGPYGIEITWLMNIAARCNSCSNTFKKNAEKAAEVRFISIGSVDGRKELRGDFVTISGRE